MKTKLTLFLLFLSLTNFAQTPCENGFAGPYPCSNVDLLAHLTPEEILGDDLNDIWGWTDPLTGKEYALVGLTNGTAFVDISDPVNPIFVGKLIEHIHARTQAPQHLESSWRDVKVYKDHAFVVSEQSHHGIQIFDLTRLRGYQGEIMEFSEDANYSGVGNAHNIVINEETGFAYAVGVKAGEQCIGGGLHMVDVRDPKNPVFAGCFDSDGYTHDAQCVIYRGPDADYYGKEICFASNKTAVTIVDVSDKDNPKKISRKGYNNIGYTHQGWLTTDQRYFLSNDELDEINFGNKTRTIIWDLKDLDNPVVLGYYFGPVNAIDHNLYTKGNLAFESNYLSGIRIVNAANAGQGQMNEVGFFDTHPESNAAQFDGTWSVYPYFASGVIVASDITKGLYILKPNINKYISENPQSVIGCQGDFADMSISVANSVAPIYQWQRKADDGTTYEDLSDNELFEGTQSSTLIIKNIDLSISGDFLRCKVTDEGEVLVSTLAKIEGASVDFTHTATITDVSFESIALGGSNLVWDFGDGNTSIEPNPVHQYAQSGTYTVKLSLQSENCGEILIQKDIEVIVLGIGVINENISFFPNPAENLIQITSSGEPLIHSKIQITTLDGKLIQEETLTTNTQSYELRLNNFKPGMYLLSIKTEDHQYQHKLFIK